MGGSIQHAFGESREVKLKGVDAPSVLDVWPYVSPTNQDS